MVHFLWKVGDVTGFRNGRKGGGGGGGGGGGVGALHLRVRRFSFWIAKSSESFASRFV